MQSGFPSTAFSPAFSPVSSSPASSAASPSGVCHPWFLGDLFARFTAFCHRQGSLRAPSSHSALIVDHGLAHGPFIPLSPTHPLWVVAPTQGLLTPHLSPQMSGLVMKKNLPAFSACLDTLVLSFLTPPAVAADTLLKKWAGCLTPSGRLYFLMLGEMAFWEWGGRGIHPLPPSHNCLSRRALGRLGGVHLEEDQEVWIRLDAPSPPTLQALELLFFQGCAGERASTRQPSFLPSATSLTLHFVYGALTPTDEDIHPAFHTSTAPMGEGPMG
jgi:hypothetical protein